MRGSGPTYVTDVQDGTGGELDMGATISSIESLRSPLLDSLVQQSLGDQGYADNQASLTSTVQTALGEQLESSSTTSGSTSTATVTGSGPIQDALSSFFTALQTLATTPSDPTARQTVVSDAQTLATAINGAYSRLQQTQSGVASDASSEVTPDQPALAEHRLAQPADHASRRQRRAAPPTTCVDTRTADINSLSSLVNVTATTQSDGTVTVALADAPSVVLVNGNDSNGAGHDAKPERLLQRECRHAAHRFRQHQRRAWRGHSLLRLARLRSRRGQQHHRLTRQQRRHRAARRARRLRQFALVADQHPERGRLRSQPATPAARFSPAPARPASRSMPTS